jgi:hypothetical protein
MSGGVNVRGTYAYSLDRESFTGIFNTREEACQAGCAASERLHAQVTEIYVGQRVAGNPQADLHAWEMIKSMRERARAAAGDDSAGYLTNLTAEQVRDLDGALESTLLRWLANYKIGPAFYRFEGISEHPLLSVAYAGFGKTTDDEVHEIGESDYPIAR